MPVPEPLGTLALALRSQQVERTGAEGWLLPALLALAARLPAPILAERIGIHQARAANWVRLAGATYADYVQLRNTASGELDGRAR